MKNIKPILQIALSVVLCVAITFGIVFGVKVFNKNGNTPQGTSSVTANNSGSFEKEEDKAEQGDKEDNKEDDTLFEEWEEDFGDDQAQNENSANGSGQNDGDSKENENSNISTESNQKGDKENENTPSKGDGESNTVQEGLAADTTYYEPLIINNNQPYLNENFLGFNGIYMLFTHMNHPSNGHVYTEEQATLELDRIKDMGIKIVRTTYSSGMIYNRTDGVWHWDDSPYFNAFLKTAKELKARDIDVAFTFTWNLANFTKTTFDFAFTDGYFPASISSTGWGSTYQGTTGQSAEEIEAIRIKQNVAGYKKFVKDSITRFRAEGLTNFKYIFGFTECNNAYMTDNKRNYDKVCEVFDIGMTATHEALKELNLRDKYKTVGPCDNWGGDFNEYDEEKYSRLVRYTVENLKEEVDIIGSHNGYDRGATFEEDDFYARPNRKVGAAMRDALSVDKEFWIDEFNVATDIAYSTKEEKRAIYDDPYAGLAFGAMVNGVMNMGGVSNVFVWMLVEQQWPNDQDGGEFDMGVQIGSGYMPNLYESSKPKIAWYSYAMIQKYLGQGKIIMCNDGANLEVQSGCYFSCIQRNDGEITLVVTNYQSSEFPVEICFQESLGGKTFYRHVYSKDSVQVTSEAIVPGVSAIAENVNTGWYDTLEPCSVTVYTTAKD